MSKKKYKIIEVYWDPTNVLWRFPIHHPDQNNRQSNMLEHSTRNHIIPIAPRHPRAYRPTSQRDLAIFFLPSATLLTGKMHPDQGNQVLILRNMARTQGETHLKISPRIRDHVQRAPGPAESMYSGRSVWKYDTFSYQGSGEHKWSTPTSILPNWKNLI